MQLAEVLHNACAKCKRGVSSMHCWTGLWTVNKEVPETQQRSTGSLATVATVTVCMCLVHQQDLQSQG